VAFEGAVSSTAAALAFGAGGASISMSKMAPRSSAAIVGALLLDLAGAARVACSINSV
jgi:hypothetical protein